MGKILRQSALLIAGFCLLVVGLCNTFVPARYRATTRIKVNPPFETVRTNSVNATYLSVCDPSHVQNERKRICSAKLFREVASKLSLDTQKADWPSDSSWRLLVLGWPPDVIVSPVGNTSFVDISVAERNPDLAARIANTIAEVYREGALSAPRDPREINDQSVSIMDPAVPPKLPVVPRRGFGSGALFFSGIMLALGCSGMGNLLRRITLD